MNSLVDILADKARIQEARLAAEIHAYENMRKQTNNPIKALSRRDGQFDRTVKMCDPDIETLRVTRLSCQGKKRASQKRKIEISPVTQYSFN